MIRSMTGFGDASEQVDGVHYAVELRSVNNRFFKATIRLPDPMAGLEAELEVYLRKRLTRGSVTLVGSLRDPGASAAQTVNEGALLAYLDHLDKMYDRFGKKERTLTIDLTALLALPGVLEPADESELLRRVRPVRLRLEDKAIERLVTMRVTEGAIIARDLRRQAEVIGRKLADIRQRAPEVVEEYHQRLKERVEEMLRRAELSTNQVDLVREVAVYADRSDIAEELSRLAGHIEQMNQMMDEAEGEPAGRTLDFLAQEMLREANTIASKSNDALISRAVVEVKSAIDRIKEQAANIE